ncbi:MAG: hypothetical protein K0U84_18680 [Actinomycetia bacterium]|nr:hypothetical protein [Actinomycetes bacterium]
MTKRRLIIFLLAFVGAVVGAAAGVFATPDSTRYATGTNVVLVPPPGVSSAEASSFWEVLTPGQISQTAAIIYEDTRWLSSAASAANVPQNELTLFAYAQPETTLLTVWVEANSAAAAESAMSDVLTTATPEVSSILAPNSVKVLWPEKASPVSGASKVQFGAAGAVGGMLVYGGLGWVLMRQRRRPGLSRISLRRSSEPDDIVEDHARHRSRSFGPEPPRRPTNSPDYH